MGGLNVLITLFAASRPDKLFVLRLRLGLVLLGAAAVLGFAQLFGALTSYASAVMLIVGGFAVITFAAVPFYSAPATTIAPTTASLPFTAASRGGDALWALGLVALFFVGQPGFTSYAAHLAVGNGVSLQVLPAIYAGCKVAAAISVLGLSRSRNSDAPTWPLSFVLATSIAVLANASSAMMFAIGLLLWELAVNLQSTRFQAAVLGRHPAAAGRWLMASIALGAAAGPALHGWALSAGGGAAFATFSFLTAFAPMAWSLSLRKS